MGLDDYSPHPNPSIPGKEAVMVSGLGVILPLFILPELGWRVG